MNKIHLFLIAAVCTALVVSCGDKTTTKPDTKPVAVTTPAKTNAAPVTATNTVKSPYDDISFNNVMKVLRDSLDAERKSSDSMSKLNTAKAYIMVIKFIKTDKEKVKKSGMTDADIKYFADDAKEKAGSRLNDFVTSATAPASIKDEAKQKQAELASL